MTKLISLKRL